MKKTILLFFTFITLLSCGRDSGDAETYSLSNCKYNGHQLYVGSRGGCYYLSSGNNKEYVDKKYCVTCN